MDNNRIDILNRDKFVDDVFNVIETLSANRKSCTFAINGEWGSGKSFVLDMLEEKLSSWPNEETAYDKYAVFHYNCWQYDYYDEPLFAIVSSMYDWAKSKEDKFGNTVKAILLYVMFAFGLVAKEATNNVVKKLTNIDAMSINEKTKEKVEKIKNKGKLDDDLYTVQESIDFTRDLLTAIAKDQTVVIVVDELDRCLPEYAIQVLERLHHLFDDIDNLIVVLAVDKGHLNNTVSQIFGFDKPNSTKDINSYLAKFIDFEISLDNGTVNNNYRLKYHSYLSMFNLDAIKQLNIDKFIARLMEPLDERRREKVFEKALLIHNLVYGDSKVEPEIMCVELMWVVFKMENKQDTISIDDKYFLPKKQSDRFNSFYDFYEKTVVHSLSYLAANSVYSYIIHLMPKDSCSLIVYLLMSNPHYRKSYKIAFQDECAFHIHLKEKTNQFADFLEIIN